MFKYFLFIYLFGSVAALLGVAYYGISEHIKTKRGDYDHLYDNVETDDPVEYHFEKTPFIEVSDVWKEDVVEIIPRKAPKRAPLSHIPSNDTRGRQMRVITRARKRRQF